MLILSRPLRSLTDGNAHCSHRDLETRFSVNMEMCGLQDAGKSGVRFYAEILWPVGASLFCSVFCRIQMSNGPKSAVQSMLCFPKFLGDSDGSK